MNSFGRSTGLPGGVNQEYVLLDLLKWRNCNNENEGFDGLSLKWKGCVQGKVILK